MQTNITGICKPELNVINQEFMLKRQKKIYVSISESEIQKLHKSFDKLPIKNGNISINFFGKQDISPILGKLYVFHVSIYRLKQNIYGNHKLILKSFTPYFTNHNH